MRCIIGFVTCHAMITAFGDGPDSTISYIHRSWHAGQMDQEPKWKSRALAIEFWFAAVLVGGSFITGLVGAIRSLFGGSSEEHTTELPSLMSNSYAVCCLKKNTWTPHTQ